MSNQRLSQFRSASGNLADITEVNLLARFGDIVQFADEFLASSPESVALDISVLPKRFFFPILRRVLDRQPNVANVVVTYTRPLLYPPGPLSENPSDWDHIPLFASYPGYGKAAGNALVIGVGFEPLGLEAHVEQGDLPVRLLLPFPSPAAASRRSWEFARLLQKNRKPEHVRVHRIHPLDPSDTFDRLVALTNRGASPVVLAPYGPKPMSLGMCLYARLTNSPVYYTQPTVYSPEYSVGVRSEDGNPAVYGYLVRIHGRDVFELT
jgi:hypothetical protein